MDDARADILSRELIAYGYLRDEIKREDSLTYQRMMAGFSFQGFLIAALALLLSNGWPELKPMRSTFLSSTTSRPCVRSYLVGSEESGCW